LTTTEAPGLDGFGPIVTLLALIAMAGLAVRRSRRDP
jgi:PGF-CTERM protein